MKKKDGNAQEKTADAHQQYLEQEMNTNDIVRVLSKYLWPADHPEVKRRVLLSLGLLGVGKLLNVQVSGKLSSVGNNYSIHFVSCLIRSLVPLVSAVNTCTSQLYVCII